MAEGGGNTTTMFLQKMADARASDLVGMVTSFVSQMQKKAVEPERDAQMVQEFLDSAERKLRSHELWSNATSSELASSGEDLERYIMRKLYSRCFASDERDKQMDSHLHARVSCLSGLLQPEHLDVPCKLRSQSSWGVAANELRRLNQFKAPRDKLQVLLNCCRVVSKEVLSLAHAETSTADDFLPVLILVVLRANPPQIWSNVEYIRRFRGSSRMHGEPMYYFTHVVSAVEFIRHLEPSQLSNIDEARVRDALDRADREAPAPTAPGSSSSISQSGASGSQQNAAKPHSNDKRQHRAAQSTATSTLPDDKDPNRVEERSLYPKGLHEEASRSHSPDEHAGVEELGFSAMDANGIQREHLVHKYEYLLSDVDSLPVSRVGALLEAYKQLAMKYEALKHGTDAILSDLHSTSSVSRAQATTSTADATSRSQHSSAPTQPDQNIDWKGKKPVRDGQYANRSEDTNADRQRLNDLITLDLQPEASGNGAHVDLSSNTRSHH